MRVSSGCIKGAVACILGVSMAMASSAVARPYMASAHLPEYSFVTTVAIQRDKCLEMSDAPCENPNTRRNIEIETRRNNPPAENTPTLPGSPPKNPDAEDCELQLRRQAAWDKKYGDVAAGEVTVELASGIISHRPYVDPVCVPAPSLTQTVPPGRATVQEPVKEDIKEPEKEPEKKPEAAAAKPAEAAYYGGGGRGGKSSSGSAGGKGKKDVSADFNFRANAGETGLDCSEEARRAKGFSSAKIDRSLGGGDRGLVTKDLALEEKCLQKAMKEKAARK